MRLPKKQWLLIQLVALLAITGGVFLIKPYLARAISVSPSSMSGLGLTGMPYLITDCQDLSDIRLNLGLEYELANDIDCSDTINWNSGAGFAPIGQNGNAFTGRIDGKGYTIDSLYIDQSGANDNLGYTGLFAQSTGRILNFKVTNATIIGNGNSGNAMASTGGIVGTISGGLLDRLSFEGAISVPDCDGAMKIGGIAGNAVRDGGWSTFDQLSSAGSINITGGNCGSFSAAAGGIIGYTDYDIINTYSTMDITLSGDTSIACSYNCRYLGGLIGVVAATGTPAINSSYYAGSLTVSAGVTPYQIYVVGGLAGYVEDAISITNAFAVPQITVPADCLDVDCGPYIRRTGGVVGNDPGTIAAGGGNWVGVYFDQDAAGTTNCASASNDANWRCNAVNTDGLDPDYFKGLSPNEPITSSFDYTSPVWQLTTGYPVLADYPPQYPDAPTNVVAVIESTSSISLSWTPSIINSGYEVLCRPTNGTWQYCGSYTGNTSITLIGLTPSTQYEFKVAPTGSPSYVGALSDSIYATTATPGFTLISNCQQLQDIQNDLAGFYELTQNIDCSDTITWNGGLGFDPIGTFSPSGAGIELFTGILKGNNYTIANLYIDQTTMPDGNLGNGLFAASLNAIIQDIKIDSPVIIGGILAATIVSFGESNLANVHVTNATITGDLQGAGGLVGYGGNNNGGSRIISRSSFQGSITHTGAAPIEYMGGLIAYAQDGTAGGYTITDNYVNASLTSASGASLAGGLIAVADSSGSGSVSVARNYAAGSMSVTGPYQSPVNPQVPDMGSWVVGNFVGAIFTNGSNNFTVANSFAHMTMMVDGPQDMVGSGIGTQLGGAATDLSSYYVDTDQAGTTQCIGNMAGTCNSISGQSNYFKNNSTNPPLNAWDFSNVWMTTSEFPVFGAAVTSGITAIAPERLVRPTVPGVTTPGGTPDVASTTSDITTGRTSLGALNNTGTEATQEAGILGAIKNFVRSLPVAVVVGFPYALFILLGIAVLVLLVELVRELRRLRVIQALLTKQRLLAEERDAFWHLAANYLRAPITLIVGGAEALNEASASQTTVRLQAIAAGLQAKVAGIMKKIEDSISLQAISHVRPRVATQIFRQAFFIVPVASVALLAILGNYAAASYRDLSPGLIGYAVQLAAFIIVSVLFYWVLGLLTQGKSKRQAAELQLQQQTTELANARHELISDTSSQLNPDLTQLEATLAQLPADQAALKPAQTLHEGSGRLREIVTSFGMLIKVQEGTGAVTATPKAIDLTGLLSKTRAKLTPQITAKGVRVTAPAVPLAVTAEADLANQVLESIIANAVDYSPTNGTVKVEAKRLRDAIQLQVTDQGQGIDKKQLDHLFQPFVRADGKSAMDMSHGGFGINLYLDKLIMEQLGGSISATSVPGKGTTITMNWPA